MKVMMTKVMTSVATRGHGNQASLAASLAFAALAVAACAPAEEVPDGGPDGGGGMVTATFTSLYGDYLSNCKSCHAPGAPGRTPDIEQTLDFSTKTTAYMTLKTGMAAGLTGNHTGCNGAPFLGATAAGSLLLAVIDQPTRQAFDLASAPNCDVDAITDATLKTGKQPSTAFVSALKTWINSGAMNN
jgi:hypothetical protein